jgi:hypothetical protein
MSGFVRVSILVTMLFGTVPRLASAQTQYVRPIKWSRLGFVPGIPTNDPFGQSLARLLQDHTRYMLQWVDTDYETATDSPEYPNVEYYYAFTNYSSYGYEQSIRPLAHFSYGVAVMIKTGIYDPAVVGMSEADALHKAELAIRGAAFSHRANRLSGLRWGGRGSGSDQWEAAYWAAQTTEAAWMLWDRLSPTTRLVAAKMIEYEADSTSTYAVPYWRNPDGTTNTPGDTKAEENAWNAHLPVVAQAMMPDHPNAPQWRAKASELQVSAYSRQSDNTSNRVIDGKAVKDWLHGFNIYEDGVVVNHDRVHPDYMVADFARLTSIVTLTLAHQYIPESTCFNFDIVYSALTTLSFTVGPSPYSSGSIAAPGGTIYNRTAGGGYTAEIYYPQGTDWTTKVTDSFLNTDLYAEWLRLDEGETFDCMGWAQARVDALIAMQNRPGHNGNVYQAGDWLRDYHSTEAVIYQSEAEAWLMHLLMVQGLVSPVSSEWASIPSYPYAACDFDHDGDVDLDDFAHLQICFTGLGIPQTDPACADTLLTDDSYVDASELARFMKCFAKSGPGVPLTGADTLCAD